MGETQSLPRKDFQSTTGKDSSFNGFVTRSIGRYALREMPTKCFVHREEEEKDLEGLHEVVVFELVLEGA